MISFRRLARCLALMVGLAAWGTTAHAACTSPAGPEGSLNYNATSHQFEFCDNANTWQALGSSNALGDRITSGTVSVTTNANGYISLTTNGTDWGYLSSGYSYLPTITSGRVSSTNISATHLQLSSPSTVLVCNSGFIGAMRYTSGTMQVCDGSNWGNIGIGVPTGTIAAFAASSCPSGWSEYTASRGRFLRGIDNGAGNDPDGTRAAGSTQLDDLKSHTHTYSRPNINGSYRNNLEAGSNGNQTNTAGVATSAAGGDETRPVNVAVTFCVYSGFQSTPATVITQLSSLTDVSVAGTTNGQVLTYSGGTWIASTTGPAVTTASSTGAIQFNSANVLGGDTANLFWDDTNNRLGIGTNVPGGQLHVAGPNAVDGSAAAGVILSRSWPNDTNTRASALFHRYVTGFGDHLAFGVSTAGATDSPLLASSIKMVLGSNGNLGLGTTTPTATLEVSGTFTVSNSSQGSTSPSLFVGTNGYVGIGTSNPGYHLTVDGITRFRNWNNTRYRGDLYSAGTNGIIFNSYDDVSTTYLPGSFNFASLIIRSGPSGTTNSLYVSSSGNIGISNTTPLARLDVNGSISASDAIQVGSSALACSSGLPGAIRYNAGNLQYCNGTSWSTLGTSTAAGSAGDIQFNNGTSFAADTGQLYWDATNNRLGIGTTSPAQELDVVGDINLSGATSRTVSFGTTGIGAPAAGSNGMKLQLYGLTAGTMTTADYALGIESGNMWFNSGGGMKWYTNGTQWMGMDSSGRMGIGTVPSANAQLSIASNTTNYGAPAYNLYSSITQNSTSNGTYYTAGVMSDMRAVVNSGITNNGWLMGAYINSLRSSAVDSGTLAGLYGQYVQVGHNSGGSTGKTTTNVFGIAVQPYGQAGTITNLYGLWLGTALTGGTVTNNWGVYQTDPSATNYFAGPVIAAQPMMILADEKTSGTGGGTCTSGSWMTRDLNTVKYNSISGASLSSNQITLPVGTYLLRGATPSHRAGRFKSRVYNVTDAATAVLGRSVHSSNSAGYESGFSDFTGVITIAGTKVFTVDMRCEITLATSGMGLASSLDTEVYSTIEITKLQ